MIEALERQTKVIFTKEERVVDRARKARTLKISMSSA